MKSQQLLTYPLESSSPLPVPSHLISFFILIFGTQATFEAGG